MKKVDCTIIPATYNEAQNVLPLVKAIRAALRQTKLTYEILFIDDSTDETPRLLRMLSKKFKEIRFIHRPPQYRTGLATAFTTGFHFAKGDIICCMDADLQHPPELIPKLVTALKKNIGVNLAIASRHVIGGSVEGLGIWYRKFASNASKILTYLLLPLTRKTKDPMSGFFAFRRNILRKRTLQPTGFKILVEMLVRIKDVAVVDIPMQMRKRFAGTTKASLKQGLAFLKHLWKLASSVPDAAAPIARMFIKLSTWGKRFFSWKSLPKLALITVALFVLVYLYQLSDTAFAGVLLTIALLQLVQGIFGIYLMVYAWEDPNHITESSSPKTFALPKYKFTAVIPARNEAKVIGHTIKSIANISYPIELMETLVVLRDDDPETIAAATKAIANLPHNSHVKIHLISGLPINKPHHLNAALKIATGDIVCIFDAEDETHQDIYNVINTVFTREPVDVIQSGVQLMNYHSNWYSMFNVIEYFLWFRSSLHFFAKHQMIPLGGNTVFFKKEWLEKVGGWDMEALTEDADIGIRLSLAGARTKVIYDPEHVTKEETPPTLGSFIKQRTRWIQGFMQILQKPDWRTNQTFSKKFFTFYVLGWPAIQAMLLFSIPFSVAAGLVLNVSPVISLIANIPVLVLVLFITLQALALHEFSRLYNKRWGAWYIVKIIIFYFPYQIILGISAIRALIRQWKNQIGWEKTEHINAHRITPLPKTQPATVPVLDQ